MEPDAHGIDEYIRANRGTYTDQAIRETLVAAGHEPAAIDEAFRRLGLDAPQDTAAVARTSGLVVLAWILFVIGGIAGLLGIGMAASFGSRAFLPIFLLGYLGIGFGIILLLRWAVPRLRIGGVWAGLLGLLLIPIFGGVMFGTCAAAFAVGRG